MTYKLFSAAYAAAMLTIAAAPAHASFMQTTNEPGGESKFYLNGASTPVDMFSGTVGSNNSGPQVNVATTGFVDIANGYANIKPVKGGSLSSLTFTPDNSMLFSDFFFRGQLTEAGSVTAIVTDAQGNPAQTFTYSGLKKNADFGSLGFFSTDGETIASVQLLGSFKEVKQIDFSMSLSSVPLPASAPMFGAALLALGAVGFGVKRNKQAAAA